MKNKTIEFTLKEGLPFLILTELILGVYTHHTLKHTILDVKEGDGSTPLNISEGYEDACLRWKAALGE